MSSQIVDNRYGEWGQNFNLEIDYSSINLGSIPFFVGQLDFEEFDFEVPDVEVCTRRQKIIEVIQFWGTRLLWY